MILSTWIGHCAFRDWPITPPPFARQVLDLTQIIRKPVDWTPKLQQIPWFDAGSPSNLVAEYHYGWWTEGYIPPSHPIPLSAVLELFRSQVIISASFDN